MQHLVLFKFDPVKLKNEFGDLEGLQKCFDELKSYIPGVGYIEIKATNPNPWPGYEDASRGWSHVLLSTHISPDDLKVYADHPQHKALQARMAKCFLAHRSLQQRHGMRMQHIVLFMLDHTRLRDQFDSLEKLQESLAGLAGTVPGCGYVELKAKNPEPWPRYADASNGYNYVLISTHASVEDLKSYAENEDHKALQGRLKKCMLAPPIRIEMEVPRSGSNFGATKEAVVHKQCIVRLGGSPCKRNRLICFVCQYLGTFKKYLFSLFDFSLLYFGSAVYSSAHFSTAIDTVNITSRFFFLRSVFIFDFFLFYKFLYYYYSCPVGFFLRLRVLL
eukprot:gene8731-6137_t